MTDRLSDFTDFDTYALQLERDSYARIIARLAIDPECDRSGFAFQSYAEKFAEIEDELERRHRESPTV